MAETKIGQRFGILTVIKDSSQRYRGHVVYECLCDCGRVKMVASLKLNPKTKSCGCLHHVKGRKLKPRGPKPISEKILKRIGITINRLTLLELEKKIDCSLQAILKCSCGNTITKPYREFIKGRVKSCGCISKERSLRAKEKRDAEPIKDHTLFNPSKDFTGIKVGSLTILYYCGVHITPKGIKQSLWYCRCDCGKEVVKKPSSFNNSSISCGCTLKPERARRAIILADKWQAKREKLLSEKSFIDDAPFHKNRRMSKTIRNKVFYKHGNHCICCRKENTLTDPLCMHHLKPHWSFPMLRCLLVNIVPLCRSCHDALHKELGSFNPSIKSQLEFLNKHSSL